MYFDQLIKRRGSGCYKWDISPEEDMLPMFVADMDFEVAPAITVSIKRRANHAVYGYTLIRPEYYDAVISWNRVRHHWDIDKKSILAVTGIVPALSAMLRVLTKPGDGVMLQTPVYNCFFDCIDNNACALVENRLIYDRDNQTYHIDFEDFEKKASDENTKIFILCSPHNPTGRIWGYEELRRMADICTRHHVLVISDEIHCDLTMPGNQFVPFARIESPAAAEAIVCTSAAKAFNLAGLAIANIIVPNETLRAKVQHGFHINGILGVNPFGVEAVIAAYNESSAWLDALNQYLWENYQYMVRFFAEHLPEFPIVKLEGTYLVWVNCEAADKTSEEIGAHLKASEHLYINHGSMYGAAGEHFIRVNIACPVARLEDGLLRLKKGLREMMRQ